MLQINHRSAIRAEPPADGEWTDSQALALSWRLLAQELFRCLNHFFLQRLNGDTPVLVPVVQVEHARRTDRDLPSMVWIANLAALKLHVTQWRYWDRFYVLTRPARASR